MPDSVSEERIKIMKLYGANVYLVSRENGGFKEAIRLADEFSRNINGFRPDQFNNILNVEAHYNTTGVEIINKVFRIDMFVSGIGTGGTLIGIAKRIKEVNDNAFILALEPLQLPIITEGVSIGKHKIEGIGDDFIPNIVDFDLISNVVAVDDEDAINMARILAKRFGLGVGISSGANLLAAVSNANNNDNVVTVFADDAKKYLSTDLVKDINTDSSLISNQIDIISIEYV